jgi:hypothetical protein
MNWEAIGAIGEILGAAGVILTLGYLAFQIRAGTKATKAAAFQAVLQSEMDFASILIENAGTREKIVTDTPLSEGEETRVAIVLYNIFMLDSERRFHQYNSGYLEASAWEGRLRALSLLAKFSIFERWKTSLGGMAHSADFLELLDELSSDDPTPSSENGH